MIFFNQPTFGGRPCDRLDRGLSRRFRGCCRSRLWARYDLPRRKAVSDLRDLYPDVLALLGARDKDYKSVDPGNAVSTSARVGDTYVVFLTDLDRLVEGTGTSSETSSTAISSAMSETHFLSHILPLFHPVLHRTPESYLKGRNVDLTFWRPSAQRKSSCQGTLRHRVWF